jgi:hypothetical protein
MIFEDYNNTPVASVLGRGRRGPNLSTQGFTQTYVWSVKYLFDYKCWGRQANFNKSYQRRAISDASTPQALSLHVLFMTSDPK